MEVLELDDALVHQHPVPYQRAFVHADDQTVTIRFLAGPVPCGQPARVEFQPLSDQMKMTLYLGDELAGDGHPGCQPSVLLVGYAKDVVVKATEPIRGRSLVDGTRN